ncbi:MAG: redox-sensing transcriptional repressor Rex [Planctomycetes bacterium]|nr:redox-sensing transcriptional repressor Rex [Planctomycetota bacterium]
MSKHDATPEANGAAGEPRLSRASVQRFSLYLRHLERWKKEGLEVVSSSQLGDALGINDAQVRKDLAYLGNLGQPGIGYYTQELISALRYRLGVDHTWNAVLVGVGNLARALLRYGGFAQQGFRFVGLFDADPQKVGQKIDGLQIHSPEKLAAVIAAERVDLAVVAVPAAEAQQVADALVAAGIKGILNFAPTLLRVPTHVSLIAVDLAVQLEQLAFLVHLAQQESTDAR